MTATRRLAAILAADVVGYSRLRGEGWLAGRRFDDQHYGAYRVM